MGPIAQAVTHATHNPRPDASWIDHIPIYPDSRLWSAASRSQISEMRDYYHEQDVRNAHDRDTRMYLRASPYV